MKFHKELCVHVPYSMGLLVAGFDEVYDGFLLHRPEEQRTAIAVTCVQGPGSSHSRRIS